MLKGLVVGDPHFCDAIPVKRVDDFLDAQFRKLKKIKDIAEEKEVDFVFLLGDVFDRARPDLWLVNKVADYLRDFPCVIYSLVGNHDLQGCRDGVPGTALGNLFTSNIVRKLEGNITLLGIPLRGIGHTREHFASLYVTDYPTILMSHNMLTPQVAPFEHLFIDDVLKVSKNNFIFAGDFHPPFEKYNAETNTRIINPGVLTRTSIAEKDITPSVIYFEATPEDLVVYHEKISLGQPSGDEVFNVDLHAKIKNSELNLKNFIDSIAQTQFESQDLEKLIQDVGTTSKLPQNIINEAISRIKIAKTLS